MIGVCQTLLVNILGPIQGSSSIATTWKSWKTSWFLLCSPSFWAGSSNRRWNFMIRRLLYLWRGSGKLQIGWFWLKTLFKAIFLQHKTGEVSLDCNMCGQFVVHQCVRIWRYSCGRKGLQWNSVLSRGQAILCQWNKVSLTTLDKDSNCLAWVFSSRVENETITVENPNVNILSSMLTLDFMPTFIPQQYVGAARCDETKSATGMSACDIFQCIMYDPPGLSRPGYDDAVSVLAGP